MKHITVISSTAAVLFATVCGLNAQTSLNELAFNNNGTIYDWITPGPWAPALPGSINVAGFNMGTGLGTIEASVTGPGVNSFFFSFLDLEADFAKGPFDDNGSANGAPTAGQHWEIGKYSVVVGHDPITGNPIYSYPVYEDFAAGALTDANSLIAGTKNDVAMALGYIFTLGAGETATLDLTSTTTLPTSGFYLEQHNVNSGEANYLYSSLTIKSAGAGVPDGGTTFSALLLAVAGLAGFKSRFARG